MVGDTKVCLTFTWIYDHPSNLETLTADYLRDALTNQIKSWSDDLGLEGMPLCDPPDCSTLAITVESDENMDAKVTVSINHTK